jgi:hypothetical protein
MTSTLAPFGFTDDGSTVGASTQLDRGLGFDFGNTNDFWGRFIF